MRPHDEITDLAKTLHTEACSLPEENAFGGNNSDSITELLDLSRQLYAAAGGNMASVSSSAVIAWLEYEPSELDIY